MITNLVRAAKTRLGNVEHFETPVRCTRCVLVYYDGGLESMAALRAACADAQPNTRIIAVYLDAEPTDEEANAVADPNFLGNAVLAAALVNARTYGFQIETLCVKTISRGITLEKLAAEYGNSLIYMGSDPQHPDWLTNHMQRHLPGRIVLIPVISNEDFWH